MKTQKVGKNRNMMYGFVCTVTQNISDLPFGEDWVDLRHISWNYHGISNYQFSGKEKDPETGFNYFGARYYDSDLSMWLSVDPLADKYPSISPYVYCANNPIKFVDPDGREIDWYQTKQGEIKWTECKSQGEMDAKKIGGRYLGKAHIAFNGSKNEKLGTKQHGDVGYDGVHINGYIDGKEAVVANVVLYGPNGGNDITSLIGFTMTSNFTTHGAIADGLYNANYDYNGKSGALKSNWVLNNRNAVPTMDGLPNLSPLAGDNYGKPFKTGIFIHATNASGFAGGNVSTGCLLLAPNDFKTFNAKMSGEKKNYGTSYSLIDCTYASMGCSKS